MDKRVRYAIVVAGAAAVIALNATVAFAADINRDKIPDSWEKTYRLSLKVNQAKGDPDGDGLNNYNEWRAHTSPRIKDTDHDGKSDPNEDYDHDGLSNRGEVKAHTNIRDTDTDNDGLSDAKEDADHDSLNNAEEINCSTNPLRADSDGDGVSDGREDYDHDGLDNQDEFIFGTNPRRGDSDGDGQEDGDEQSGIVVSFDQTAGVLAVRILGSTDSTISAVVTSATEFEWAGDEDGANPTTMNLTAGAIVKEIETHMGGDGLVYADKIELRSGTAVRVGDDYEDEDN